MTKADKLKVGTRVLVDRGFEHSFGPGVIISVPHPENRDFYFTVKHDNGREGGWEADNLRLESKGPRKEREPKASETDTAYTVYVHTPLAAKFEAFMKTLGEEVEWEITDVTER